MKPMRSILFVPAHRGAWVEKAIAAGADGLIIDLEDSVPAERKDEARPVAAESIRPPGVGATRKTFILTMSPMPRPMPSSVAFILVRIDSVCARVSPNSSGLAGSTGEAVLPDR